MIIIIFSGLFDDKLASVYLELDFVLLFSISYVRIVVLRYWLILFSGLVS